MRCFSGTSKSTAGASAAALRMPGACARNLVPPVALPRQAKGWPGDTFCTCVLLNSEASGPKKGRKSGCVAAGRGDLGEAGSALTFSNWCTHVRVMGRGRWGSKERVDPDPKKCSFCSCRNGNEQNINLRTQLLHIRMKCQGIG